jgi:hypothetical protein
MKASRQSDEVRSALDDLNDGARRWHDVLA